MVERGVRGRVRRDTPGERGSFVLLPRGEVAPKPLSFPPNPHAAPLPPRSGVPSRGLCFGILSPDIVRGVGGWTRPNDRGEKRRLEMDPVEERRDCLFSVFAPARSCHGESGWPSPAPRSSSSPTMSSVRRGRPAKLFLLWVVMVTEALDLEKALVPSFFFSSSGPVGHGVATATDARTTRRFDRHPSTRQRRTRTTAFWCCNPHTVLHAGSV